MSGTARTLQAKMSDGTVVTVRNAAGWDTYSFVRRADGTWREVCRGSSASSVRSRTITALRGSHNFEVHYVSEIMPEPIEQYFASHPVTPNQGIRIQQVFVRSLGWVTQIPGGYFPGSKPTDSPFKVKGSRPGRTFCRLLATRYNVTAIAVGNPYLSADFQMAELGLRLPKISAAA